MKKQITFKIFWVIVCALSIGVALFSCLTYGRAHIINDVATASLLAKSQLASGEFFPKTWQYAHSDLWAFDLNIFVLPFMLICKDQSLARMLGSAVVIILTCVGMMLVSKKVYKDDSYLLAIPFLLLFLPGTYNWVIWEASYTIIMMYLAFAIALCYMVYEKQSWKNVLLLAIVLSVSCLEGTRFVAEITVPAIGAIFFLEYGKAKNKKIKESIENIKRFCIVFGTLVIPSALGIFVYNNICEKTLINSAEGTGMSFLPIITDCWTNFENCIIYTMHVFGYIGGASLFSLVGIATMVGIVCAITICLVIPIIQLKKMEKESDGVKFLLLFMIIHNAIMIIMFIFMGFNEPRYLLTSIFLSIVVAARLVYGIYLKEDVVKRYFWSAIILIMIFVQVVSILKLGKGWNERLACQKEFAGKLEETGAIKGYADTFYSGPLEVYSDFELSMGQVRFSEEGIQPMEWLIDMKKFEPSNEVSFILLSEFENNMFTPISEAYLGQSIDSFCIDNADGEQMYVYVYDYDVAEKLVR